MSVCSPPSLEPLAVSLRCEGIEQTTFRLEFDLRLRLQGFTCQIERDPIDFSEGPEGDVLPIYPEDPYGDGLEINARSLRKVPLGALVEFARLEIIRFRNTELRLRRERNILNRREREVFQFLEPLSPLNADRPGRRGRSDLEHATLAKKYVECLIASPRSPRQLLSERTGLDPRQLDGLLHQARRQGFLTKTRRGISGGDLTQKARETLLSALNIDEEYVPEWEYFMNQ